MKLKISIFLLVISVMTLSISLSEYNNVIPQYIRFYYLKFFDNALLSSVGDIEYRLIAHGGGGINGKVYTNSLEALNNSYKNGFKFMELDLHITSDNHIVAVHDWSEWSEFVGLSDMHLPPSLREFKKYKLFNSYTPLDINDINNWFISHPDTYLVTDKIKDLTLLANFIFDTNRVYVETFDIQGYKDALNLGFQPMFSMPAIKSHKDKAHVLDLILRNNIEYVVAPSVYAFKYPELLKIISSIAKVFSYGQYSGKDKSPFFLNEVDTICIQSDYFYGTYSDFVIPLNFNCLIK